MSPIDSMIAIQKSKWCSFSIALSILVGNPLLAADLWVDASATEGGTGSVERPFKEIQSAALLAAAGDTVHVRPGTYRERVIPAYGGEEGRPIVYRSVVPLGAVITGADVWKPEWRDEGGSVYSATVDDKMFTDRGYVDGGNPYQIKYDWDESRNYLPPAPFKRVDWTLGQVIVDGANLDESSSRKELDGAGNGWWYDPEAKRIFVRLMAGAPGDHLLEITSRRGVFRPKTSGLGYIEVRGFVFEYCANQFPAQFWQLEANAQSGMVGTAGGHHWVFEGNVFQHAKTVALTFGSLHRFEGKKLAKQAPAGFHRIVGNLFRKNGAIGAMGFGHRDVVFERNVFSENNALLNNAYEIGGIKTHQATGMRIEGNWFLDNECMGVWLDNTWRRCRVTRNIFAGNRGKNVFFEMDDNKPEEASLVDRNFFLPGRPKLRVAGHSAQAWKPWSCGVYAHDADGVKITHNLFAGDGYGVYARKITERKGGASYFEVTRNIFAGSKMTAVCLPVDSPPLVQGNSFGGNVYPLDERPFVATGWSLPNKVNGGVDRPSLMALLKRTGKDAAGFPFGDPAKDPAGYRLTMAEWRKGMKQDQTSVQAAVSCDFDRQAMTVTLDVSPEALKLGVGTTDTAGPFPGLKEGKQVFQLPKPDASLLNRYPDLLQCKDK